LLDSVSDKGGLNLITPYHAKDLRAANIPADKAKRLLCGILTDHGDRNTIEVPSKRMKVFHLEASQMYAGEITKHAHTEAQGDEADDFVPTKWKLSNDQLHTRGRLPVLIANVDHDEPCWPCLEIADIKPKCLRLPVFLKLKEITDLSGAEYLKAWLDCLLCTFRGSTLTASLSY
jgi:hypothetical protein